MDMAAAETLVTDAFEESVNKRTIQMTFMGETVFGIKRDYAPGLCLVQLNAKFPNHYQQCLLSLLSGV
jgi:hypothetical protein